MYLFPTTRMNQNMSFSTEQVFILASSATKHTQGVNLHTKCLSRNNGNACIHQRSGHVRMYVIDTVMHLPCRIKVIVFSIAPSNQTFSVEEASLS